MESIDRIWLALRRLSARFLLVRLALIAASLVAAGGSVCFSQATQDSKPADPPKTEIRKEAIPRIQPRRLPLVPAVLQARMLQNADNGGLTIHGKLSRAELEEMLYGLLGGSRQAFRRLRREAIQRSIDRVDQVCKLNDSQKEKIDGSIEIDIARIESTITSLLSEIREDTPPEKKQAIYNNAWQRLRTMQQQDTLDQDALWKKVLHATLTAEQQKQLDEDEKRVEATRERSGKYRLLLLVQRKVGLTTPDRQRLLAFLLDPKHSSIQSVSTLFEALSELSDSQRNAILSEETFQAWKQQATARP
ncbi:hypothetical protein VN12_15460 [Pirellula sp. SH-Sr6A]|uniref:hypothetical protein n=1 Tax=Pirellula sp. SH-Sr6A TaxID=1632865 RepID=UPI00078D376B|nr:hypothetical protein [Pirellula sp. SH-Sr6A]AMV33524.1 hypothetical protein VN12_15460 [Pirellula sp. SH-Sr6A]